MCTFNTFPNSNFLKNLSFKKNLEFNYLKKAINFWIDRSFMSKFHPAIEQFNANLDHEDQFKENVDVVHRKLQV